jgi:hypothetical protein
MKFKFIIPIIGFMITLLTHNLKAQGKIDASSIAVMKKNDLSKGLLLGDPTSKAILILGNPTAISTEVDEMDEKQMTLYKYGSNAVFYFIDDKLSFFNFEIAAPFTLGKINGPVMTTKSSSLSALPWPRATLKQESINVTAPVPGGGTPFQTLNYDAGSVYDGDIDQELYFAITYVVQGDVRGVGVYPR